METTPLHGDERGVIAEIALKPNAAIPAHTNSNAAYLLVIEGGGWVQVGDERARVAAGDAVVWPANAVHAVWTELTPMRAIVVEFAAQPGDFRAEPRAERGLAAAETGDPTPEPRLRGEPSQPEPPMPADGSLAPKPDELSPDRESREGEPW